MRVGSDTRWRASGQHAGGDHRATGSRAGPQVVGNLLGERRRLDTRYLLCR